MNRHVRLSCLSEAEEKIKRGDWQLHRFRFGFVITEIKQYPEGRALLVWVLSGERLDEWKDEAFQHLKVFGKEHGCKTMEALCRLGLTKKLRSFGFKTTRVELKADIL